MIYPSPTLHAGQRAGIVLLMGTNCVPTIRSPGLARPSSLATLPDSGTWTLQQIKDLVRNSRLQSTSSLLAGLESFLAYYQALFDYCDYMMLDTTMHARIQVRGSLQNHHRTRGTVAPAMLHAYHLLIYLAPYVQYIALNKLYSKLCCQPEVRDVSLRLTSCT